jgi:hypothetical protein
VKKRTAGDLDKEACESVTGTGDKVLKLQNFLQREKWHDRDVKVYPPISNISAMCLMSKLNPTDTGQQARAGDEIQ